MDIGVMADFAGKLVELGATAVLLLVVVVCCRRVQRMKDHGL